MEQEIITVLQEDAADFRMRHDKIDGNSSLIMSKNHYHKSYEVYFQLVGEKYYFIRDKTYHIKKGDMVLINSFDLHRTSIVNNNTTERILVRISENFISTITNSYYKIDLFSCFKHNIPILRLPPNFTDIVKAHLFKMLKCYDKYKTTDEALTDLYMRTLTLELLILLNQYYISNQYTIYEHPSDVHKKISEAVTYINNTYMENITLDTLSSEFHISKYYFVRLFKEVTGLTFIDYLNIIRLKEAQKLLLQTDFSISRISNEIGYSDASYFCRVFKKYYHISPAQYKKQYSRQI